MIWISTRSILLERKIKLPKQTGWLSIKYYKALEKLVRIYEVTHDWEPAIEAYGELKKLTSEPDSEGRIAHYYCELAEHAVADRDFTQARELLKKAGSERNGTVRAQLAMAALSQQTDDHKAAIKIFRQVMADEPRLIGEIVPRLAESCRAIDDQALFSKCLEQLQSSGGEVGRAIALAAIYDPHIQNSTALSCLRDYLLADPMLSNIVAVDQLQTSDPEELSVVLERIRKGLGRLFPAGHRYSCTQCGYLSSQLLWQCPGCRSWETVSPADKFSFSST